MRSGSLLNARRRRGRRGDPFVLQWHLTARCNEDCSHCYAMDSPDLKDQLDHELSLDACMEVLGSFDRFLRKNDLHGRINLTGGDPLLKPGLLEMIARAKESNIKVGILGNPSLLDYEMAKALKDAGVFRYQLSMDGLERTHDRIRRRKGHFEDTLRAIRTLNDVGLPSVIMFTLSRQNMSDLTKVVELVSDLGVRVFDFSRIVPQGRGRYKDMLTSLEYRDLLRSVLNVYDSLEKRGTRTYFGRKEALWNLLYLENGRMTLPSWDGLVHSGCSVGSKVLTLLADGTVYPCRRLPIRIGKVPGDDFADIFFRSDAHVQLQNVSNFKKCRSCYLLPYCRGCPAVAFGVSEDPFSADPQCWKDGMDDVTIEKVFKLEDHARWNTSAKRHCASCDAACGGCGHICAACSEVCASCSGCGD